jgi:hypothetical protein
MWLVIVVGIDVSHVYSTIFKTYIDPIGRHKYKKLLVITPVLAIVCGFSLHYFSSIIFWRVLAYTALFHFVRQQYGIYRLYVRSREQSYLEVFLDTVTIYLTTLYPVIFWHAYSRDFNWFVPGDFAIFVPKIISQIVGVVYFCIFAIFCFKELLYHRILDPKNLFLFSSALSWYYGIVYFNSDLVFAVTNVITHGIPYTWLIYYTKNQSISSFFYNSKNIKLFLCYAIFLIVIAYCEEGMWDALVWRENQSLFNLFWFLPDPNDSLLLSCVVALLAAPQITHYVLDGFIWKKSAS